MRRGGGGRGDAQNEAAPDFNMYGLANFSAVNYMQTAGVGGEAGAASGFGFVTLVRIDAITSTVRTLSQRYNGSNAGWQHYISAANQHLAFAPNNSTVSSAYTFTASDVGKIFLLWGLHTGAANQIAAVVNRTIWNTGAQVGYTAHSGPTGIGQLASAAPATGCTELANLTFLGVPNAAQIAAFADQVRALGDLPEAFVGATVTHRWSAKDELRGVVNPVGRKTYGARGFSSGAFYSTSNGIAGAPAGFWVSAIVKSSGVASPFTARSVISKVNYSAVATGWSIDTGGGDNSIAFKLSNGTGTIAQTPSYTFLATDHNQQHVVHGTYDGTTARLYFDGVDVGSVAVSGYVAASVACSIGSIGAGAGNSAAFSIYGVAGGHATLTSGDVLQHLSDIRANGRMVAVASKTDHLWDVTTDVGTSGAMPATLVDRAGSDTMTRTGSLDLTLDIATGPFAPAQLTDTATRASADALLRVGVPSVRTIDPTVDGRRTLGVQGFSASNFLQCDTVPGVDTGFFIGVPFMISAAGASAFRMLVSRRADTVPGWALQTNSTNVQLTFVVAGASLSVSANIPLSAADYGVPLVAVCYYAGSGGTCTLLLRRPDGSIAVSTSANLTQPFSPYSGPMMIGRRNVDALPADNHIVYGLTAGNAALTLADAIQHAEDIVRAGYRPVALAGKTQHLWDPTADILASGVELVPAQVLDRAPGGTDHLINAGAIVLTHASQKGLRLCTASLTTGTPAALVYQTIPGGGIRGTQAGFHITCKLTVTSQVAGQNNHNFVSTYAAPITGFNLSLISNNTQLSWTTYNGSGGTTSAIYTVPAGKVGVPLIVDVVHTGSQLQLFVDGVQIGVDVPVGSYTASAVTVPFVVGNDARLLAVTVAENITFHAVSGGHTVPTPAELLARATASISAGSLTQLAASKTQKHWDIQAAIVGDVVPGRVVDTVAGEVLTGIGSPLVLAQRTERVWSYETSPVMLGATGLTDNDYYGHATQGFQGATTGYWISVLLYIMAGSSSATRILVSNVWGTGGWYLTSSGANATLQWTSRNTSDTNGAVVPVLASDVGKLLLLSMQYNPAIGKLQTFTKRIEAGQVTCAGYVVPTGGMHIGRFTGGAGFGASNLAVLGVSAGKALISLAEYQAQYDACIAQERMIEVPGKTDFLVDLTTEGALPAQLTDRKGSAHLPKVGAPALHSQYARAWGI